MYLERIWISNIDGLPVLNSIVIFHGYTKWPDGNLDLKQNRWNFSKWCATKTWGNSSGFPKNEAATWAPGSLSPDRDAVSLKPMTHWNSFRQFHQTTNDGGINVSLWDVQIVSNIINDSVWSTWSTLHFSNTKGKEVHQKQSNKTGLVVPGYETLKGLFTGIPWSIPWGSSLGALCVNVWWLNLGKHVLPGLAESLPPSLILYI